ncbi:MAG: hypothetical protein GF416_09370 [Candidatus Altiarchaeales archaeon]|nr:hypothetical protein [Candidatus Altiarchaeales archaeon]MBD3417329.1 hypothetical protein [Candidatus Altiarchaeales archaeon]
MKKKKLNLSREKEFLFDLKEIFHENGIEDPGVFLANTLNKATRDGIDDAIEYVRDVDDNNLPEDVTESIVRLLKRYSTMR